MISRRRFVASSAAAGMGVACSQRGLIRSAGVIHARQFHNQPAASTLHSALVNLWAAVEAETSGKLVVETFPQNDDLPGSDPQALEMLTSGDLEFFTAWSVIIGSVVPPVQIQALAYLFTESQQVFRFLDGDFGDYLRDEMALKGIYSFRRGCFENGFRHISSNTRPVKTADDLVGMKIRTPISEIYSDFFRTLGAIPQQIAFADIYQALKDGRADGQDNPIEVTALNRFYEVQRYMSLTSHAWSGFNQLANLRFWNGLPVHIREVVERNVQKYVVLQRQEQDRRNGEMLQTLRDGGMSIHQADSQSIRERLGPYYVRWRKEFGERAWKRLESHVGKVG